MKIIAPIAIVVIILFCLCVPKMVLLFEKRDAEKASKDIIQLLNEYITIHEDYPFHLREINVVDTMEEAKIHYFKKDSGGYELYYYTGFDTYWIYDSNKGCWEYPF